MAISLFAFGFCWAIVLLSLAQVVQYATFSNGAQVIVIYVDMLDWGFVGMLAGAIVATIGLIINLRKRKG